MMTETFIFSQHKLKTFLACQRRFQLRYLDEIPWPALPIPEPVATALARGRQFHQLLERHFLELPLDPATIAEVEVRRWWSLFQGSGLTIPPGRRLPELSLTIPVGRHLLTGRFDLLVVGENEGKRFLHIFDWKSGKAQDVSELKHKWQTRLYLAMLAQGGAAFQEDGRPVDPDNIAIIYWYVTEPEAPRTIQYRLDWHERNWREIQALVSQIDRQLGEPDWPLTDDWSQCRQCAYQAYCGRQEAGLAAVDVDEMEALIVDRPVMLEPDSP